jgi:hypothetical protein
MQVLRAETGKERFLITMSYKKDANKLIRLTCLFL